MKPITKPTQFELAMLAATVALREEKPLSAVEYAWELWCDCGEVIQRDGSTAALILERAVNDPAVWEHWKDEGMMPQMFPATLNDFLNLIVRAKTPADSMKRLRDFILYEQAENPDLYRDPADIIAEMKAQDQEGGCFANFETWHSLASGYANWWNSQKSRKARESASKRKNRS